MLPFHFVAIVLGALSAELVIKYHWPIGSTLAGGILAYTIIWLMAWVLEDWL